MAKILKAVFISIVIYYLKCAEISACINENPCLCEIDEYNKIDLTQVTQKLKIDEFLEADDSKGQRFYFHGCKDGNFNATAHHIVPNKTQIFPGSLIYANLNEGNKTEPQVLGRASEIKFNAVEGQKDAYQIVYKRGDNVTARIRLLCIDFEDTLINILPTEGTNPSLALSSRYACIVTHHAGLSTGSVLLIIFFITFGVYFVGGCIILYFMRGARGIEMIPNIDFWRSLPGLVKDGIIFLFSGCNPTAITTPETYDRI